MKRSIYLLLFLALLFSAYKISPSLPAFYTILATEAMIFGLLAVSLDLIMGYVGLVSLGHAAFFGTGAYVSGLLLIHFDCPLLLAILIAILVNALLGFIIGGLSIRSRGIYFGMLTLAFCEFLRRLIYDWRSVTGGSDGIAGILLRPIQLGPFTIPLSSPSVYLCFAMVLIAAGVFLSYLLVQSDFGSILKAIGSNEQRARFIGYNVRKYKLISFVVSAGLAGLSGSLYSPMAGFASHDLLQFHLSGKVVLMCLIGGLGTIVGPFLGGIFLMFLESIVSSLIQGYLVFIGLTFILIVIFLPKGLMGIFKFSGGPSSRVLGGVMSWRNRLFSRLRRSPRSSED